MTFEEAEHLADLQRHEEAWAAIDELEPEMRTHPRALQVRVRCCAGLARWEMGNEIAAVLAEGDLIDRMMAAGFYHCLTVAHLQDGDKLEARAVAARAVKAWPGCRMKMLEDNRLAGLF